MDRRTFVKAMPLGAAALLGAAAGCSNSGAGGGSGSGAVKMVMFPGPQGDALQVVVDKYNSGQGVTDGVEVQMVLLSRTGTFSREATQMAAKSSELDLYFTTSYIVGQHAPSLDPLEGFNNSLYFPISTDGLSLNGKLMAMPLNVSNHFLFYRKDLIDGLVANTAVWPKYRDIASRVIGKPADPKPAADWDWDDYIAMAAYFTRALNPDSPTKFGTALQAKKLMFNVMIWNDFLWSNGGGWLKDGKADLTSQPAHRAMDIYSTIYTKGLTSPNSTSWESPETQEAFRAEDAAFGVEWVTSFASLNDASKSPKVAGKIAVTRIPGGKRSMHTHTQGFGLNKYSKNKEKALTWLRYLNSEVGMTDFAVAGGIPAVPSVMATNPAKNPVFPDMVRMIPEYGYSAPVFKGTSDAYNALAEDLSAAWVGQEPIDSALTRANADLTKLL